MLSEYYSLLLEEYKEYIFVRVTPRIAGLDIFVTYLDDTVRRVRDRGATKLLFLREMPLEISAHQYEVMGAAVMNLTPTDLRVAVVDRSPMTPVVVEKINNAALQKSRAIKAFADLDEARMWLLSCE